MTAASRVDRAAPTPAQRYVRALDAPSDVMLVGGKAVAFGRAMRARSIRVADSAFVLTTRRVRSTTSTRALGRSPMLERDARRAVCRRRDVAGVRSGGRAQLGGRRRLARDSRSPGSSTRSST